MDKLVERIGLAGFIGSPAFLILDYVTGWRPFAIAASVCLVMILVTMAGAMIAHLMQMPAEFIGRRRRRPRRTGD